MKLFLLFEFYAKLHYIPKNRSAFFFINNVHQVPTTKGNVRTPPNDAKILVLTNKTSIKTVIKTPNKTQKPSIRLVPANTIAVKTALNPNNPM